MTNNPHQYRTIGYSLLLNVDYFSLGFGVIMEADNVFHLLVLDKIKPIFADQYLSLDAAKRGFLEKFGNRYLLEPEDTQANWSELHQKN